MFDYKRYFEVYCRENGLDIQLSFDMPEGYEEANGTFDLETKTVCINAEYLENAPDFEKAFYLFHELRHASQYLRPEQFDDIVIRSLQYVIMYDGTCYKVIDGRYHECRLEGGEAYFTDIYAGQPYEVDANTYAYEKTKSIYGDSEDLNRLYRSWLPSRHIPEEEYNRIYSLIDDTIGR